jgi:DNA-binding response OmpR family regulator
MSMSQENPSPRIILVEDDHELASMVHDFLSQNGFHVDIEANGLQAQGRILAGNYDIVILDLNLPGLDGFSICKAIRGLYHGVIFMLTARGEELDEVIGLDLGADDYMAKPVRPRALLARLRAHLRKGVSEEPSKNQPLVVGDLLIDPTRRWAELDGKTLDLTTAEFDLLKILAEHAGQTVSRDEISQIIHGMKYDGVDRSIDLRISRLRKKLGDDPVKPRRIKSIRGTGYQLSAEP